MADRHYTTHIQRAISISKLKEGLTSLPLLNTVRIRANDITIIIINNMHSDLRRRGGDLGLLGDRERLRGDGLRRLGGGRTGDRRRDRLRRLDE